jgi:uncharacterized protein GlcG (DUF336 family)
VTVLNLEAALAIAQTALAEGRRRGFLPLTVSVLDAGGHVVALLRSDGSSLLRPQIATAKAWGALGMGFGSREIARRATQVPVFIGALIELSGGNMAAVPGGVLIRDSSKAIVGAVGVTGDTSDNDEILKAAGLVADAGG